MSRTNDGEIRFTYVGWQGWLVATDRTRIAIDAVLVDAVGRGPAQSRADFHFPLARAFCWQHFPRLNAYILTHEHEDHFNVPTLARLDRKIPVFLSARASVAAHTLLAEMGFAVTPIEPGSTVQVGDLELAFFTPTDAGASRWDEWDTLGFSVRRSGAGTFFTPVDVSVTEQMSAYLHRIQQTARGDILAFLGMELSTWPAAAAHFDPLMSHRRDPDAHRVRGQPLRAARLLGEGEPIQPHPGLTVTMRDERVVGVEDRTDFLESPDQPARSVRPFRKRSDVPVSPPVSGQTQLGPDEQRELDGHLQDLAAHLYARSLYTLLLSLDAAELKGIAPTFALMLLVGEGDQAIVYEYEPNACRFKRLDDPPDDLQDTYAGTLLMWAGDFLALARGHIEPRTLGHSLEETWIFEGYSLWRDWWVLYHPQRFPERVLAQYRRALLAEGTPEILVCAADA